MASRIFNSLDFQNPNKYLTRQHLQPYILQQILQQQHLAKYGYLADSALHLMNWRNASVGMMPGYHQAHPFLFALNSGHHHLASSACGNYQTYNNYPPQQNNHQEHYQPTSPGNDVDFCNSSASGPENSTFDYIPQMDEEYEDGLNSVTEQLDK
ncbi:unnamed protein product [Mesocestoides corti]|nr:unnamed protein product [Mesocestoides corti]